MQDKIKCIKKKKPETRNAFTSCKVVYILICYLTLLIISGLLL